MTGGAQGLGAKIAERPASEGLSVTVLDVNEAAAKATAERIAAETGSPVYGFACNVTDRPGVKAALTAAADAMGGLDTYVGNAGSPVTGCSTSCPTTTGMRSSRST